MSLGWFIAANPSEQGAFGLDATMTELPRRLIPRRSRHWAPGGGMVDSLAAEAGIREDVQVRDLSWPENRELSDHSPEQR